MLNNQLIAPVTFDSYLNQEGFNYWLEHHLLKKLSPGHTIIIDNARFHKSKQTQELVETAQCQLVFLPPYSPDLNPIEKRWAQVKRKVRSIIKHVASLDQAINIVLSVH